MYIMNRRTVNRAEQLRLRDIELWEDAWRRAANLDILRREEELNQALLEDQQRNVADMEVEEDREEGPREIELPDAAHRAANLGILEIEQRNVAPMMEGGKRKKKSKKSKKAKKAKKAKKSKKAKNLKNLRRHAVKQTRRHRR